jgi:hypothetical protein
MISLRLKKEHYDKKTKLEQMVDYYDCPVCFCMKEELLECPSCTSRACLACVHDFSKGEYLKNPAAKNQGFGKCMMCHKFLVQKPMHKFLLKLLNELRFKCNDCLRVMPYERLKGHKGRAECQRGLEVEEDNEVAI